MNWVAHSVDVIHASDDWEPLCGLGPFEGFGRTAAAWENCEPGTRKHKEMRRRASLRVCKRCARMTDERPGWLRALARS
jgi:hypothetical protein